MKVVKYFILPLFFCNVIFSLENEPQCPAIHITLKSNDLLSDVIFPKSKNSCPNICLDITAQDIQIVQNLHISFNSKRAPSKLIKDTNYKEIRKTENLNFKVISWLEEVETPETRETRKYYLVLLESSKQILFWIESEAEIDFCELINGNKDRETITIMETKKSLVFSKNQKIQSALIPIVPSTFEKKDETERNLFLFTKDRLFVPNIFGFIITVGEKFPPTINLYPSDMGPEYGIQINILSNNPVLPFYNIYLAPGNTVVSFNKKRFEFWGKSCIVEHEKRIYNILGFIDIHAITYKDKYNQWSLAFYKPTHGYLQLNGKINTLLNSLLYIDTIQQGSRTRGLCQIDKSDYFDFEIPTCIENKIPIPEKIMLNSPTPKNK